jgi:hypothetical protein
MAEAATLLFCDHVYVDPGSGKPTLFGVFTELRPTKYPTPFRNFSVFAMLRGEPGENGTLSLECITATTEEVILESSKNLIFGRSEAIPFVFQIGEFRFPQAGWYRFRLEFDQESIAENLLYLHEVT